MKLPRFFAPWWVLVVLVANIAVGCAPTTSAAPAPRATREPPPAIVEVEPESEALGEVTPPVRGPQSRPIGLPAPSAREISFSSHVALQQPFRAHSAPPERIVIPAIDLDSRVIGIGTRWDRAGSLVWETAAFAVGHHQGSANPGEIGNVVLSGHISSPAEGAVFRRLPQLKIDDGIAVVTGQQSYLYRIREIKVVLPSAIEVTEPTGYAAITLITCVPDGVYSHRLVVRAEAV